MRADLVIIGAGGFARETAAAVTAVNEVRAIYRLLGHLDDNPALHGQQRAGVPILGGLELLGELPDASVVVCVGNPRDHTARRRVVARLDQPLHRYATIVHPAAAVARDCLLGAGTVLLAHTALTASVRVGNHVAVMPQVVLTHDDVVDDFATLTAGVRVGGAATIGPGAYIGAGALIRESVHVGAWSMVGMGSVVLGDIPAGQVWVGQPAHYLRDVPPDLLAESPEQGSSP